LPVLTETIPTSMEKSSSEGDDIGEKVIKEIKETDAFFSRIFNRVSQQKNITDRLGGVWQRRNNHIQYERDIYESNYEEVLHSNAKTHVFLLLYSLQEDGKEHVRMIGFADKIKAQESILLLYDGTKDEKLIKTYNNGTYKSGPKLTQELKDIIKKREWGIQF